MKGSFLHLNNQSVFAFQVFDNGWVRSLVVGVLGITEVRVAVATNNQIHAMGLGGQFHVGSISVVRKSQNPLDALGFEFINVFLHSWNGIGEGNGGPCIGDVARGLWTQDFFFWVLVTSN